jgi:YD repeat-containing protein
MPSERFSNLCRNDDTIGKLICWQDGYDAAGRLTDRTDPMGHRAEYVYDDVGRRTEIRHRKSEKIGDTHNSKSN